MKQTRKLTDEAMGMFNGPQPTYGQTLGANTDLTSMTTHGNENGDTTWPYEDYPYAVSGKTRLDPNSLEPGSNLSAVHMLSKQLGSDVLAQEAGVDGVPTGNSVGGTAAY
jgi:hypothetical protein